MEKLKFSFRRSDRNAKIFLDFIVTNQRWWHAIYDIQVDDAMFYTVLTNLDANGLKIFLNVLKEYTADYKRFF